MPAEKRLNIVLACSEMTPFAKTGGLADVSAALAAWFDTAGHDLRLLMPFYSSIDEAALKIEVVPELQDLEMDLGERRVHYWIVRAHAEGSGPPIYLLQCPELYRGEQLYSGPDEHLRFILLSRATIEMCQRMHFRPDIFHVHDWHAALVPLYLKTLYAWDNLFSDSKTVLTIHNIGYQGVFGTEILTDTGLDESTHELDQDDLGEGRINFMKAGIMHADLLTTVSPTYAREILEPEYGMGLEGLLQERRGSLVGILNGVDYDEWDPAKDSVAHPLSVGRHRSRRSAPAAGRRLRSGTSRHRIRAGRGPYAARSGRPCR